MTNENNKNIKFNDYYEFIYLNSHLTKEEAKSCAVDAWNKGLTKYEALKQVNK